MRAATMLLALFGFLATSIPIHAQKGPTSPRVDPDTFAREWLEAWNSRDVDRILTFYAEDAVYEDVAVVSNGWGEPWSGHETIREALVDGFEAIPDMSFENVSVSSVGDRLAVEWIMTGTHLGDYPGLPATGRSISIRGVSLIELEGDEIAWERDYYDAYLMLTQLGAVPALDAAGASAERTQTSTEENEEADSTARVAPAGASALPDGTASAIRRVFRDVWSRGDLSAIDELFTPDFVGHFPETTVHGREELRAAVIAHRRSFPDWTEEVEETIVDCDRVVVRFTSSGTNSGEFLGRPPTGNRVEISEVVIFRLRDGKIAEQWVYPDILAMQRQLGQQVRP